MTPQERWSNPDRVREVKRRCYEKYRQRPLTIEQIEKMRASLARYRNSQKGRATVAAWRQANKDRVRAYKQAYYAANAERIKAQNDAYQKAHYIKKSRRKGRPKKETNREHMRRARKLLYESYLRQRLRVAGKPETQENMTQLKASLIARREKYSRISKEDREVIQRHYAVLRTRDWVKRFPEKVREYQRLSYRRDRDRILAIKMRSKLRCKMGIEPPPQLVSAKLLVNKVKRHIKDRSQIR